MGTGWELGKGAIGMKQASFGFDTGVAVDTSGSDEPRQAWRRAKAGWLCHRAQNVAGWLLADNLARAWGCSGCQALGAVKPTAGRDKRDRD